MDERTQFLAACLTGEDAMSVLCRRFGVSRKTGYKWLARYRAEGPLGLGERSHAPHRQAQALPLAVAEAIVALRGRHPHWGPRKLRAWLEQRQPGRWPAASTIGLLRCQVVRAGRVEWVQPLFEATFREYGLPRVLRTDNGPPFAAVTVAGLSRLAVWWIRLGIRPERIAPGHPEQNAEHERLHRTLKQETAQPPRPNQAAQQRAFDGFRRIYNEERPHEALDQQPPATRYAPSPRPYPERLPSVAYPDTYLVRRAHPNGDIKWRGHRVRISQALAGEPVGLEEIADGRWRVWFGPIELGSLDARRPERLQSRIITQDLSPISPV